jgi:hypothetical protein
MPIAAKRVFGLPERARMAKKKKPKGFKAFDELTRALVQIPKGEVDKKVADDKADRLRRKRRKKK